MTRFAVEPDFDFGSAEYRSFFSTAGATAFQHPVWLSTLYRRCVADRGGEPFTVVGRSERGEPEAVIPLIRTRHRGESRIEAAFCGVSDYVRPVVSPALARDGGGVTFPATASLGTFGAMRVESVREDDARLWQMLFRLQSFEMDYGAHAVQIGSPFSEWRRMNLGPEKAAEIDRKSRRLREAGPLQLQLLGPFEASKAIAEIARFRKGRFAGDPLQTDVGLGFYSEVAEQGAESGFTRCYRLASGQGAIAYVFGITDRDRFCYLLLGCDYERYAKFSPGLLILDHVMAAWAAEGGRIFDFTVGDEAFKSAFRCERTRMVQLFHPADEPGTSIPRTDSDNAGH